MASDSRLFTKNQLVAMASEWQSDLPQEQKEAARRLLEAGIFRQPTPEESLWEDHPFHLSEVYCTKSIVETIEELKASGQITIQGVTFDSVPAVPATSVQHESTEPVGDGKPSGQKPERDDGINPHLKTIHIPTQDQLASQRLDNRPRDPATAEVVPVIPLLLLPPQDFGRQPLQW